MVNFTKRLSKFVKLIFFVDSLHLEIPCFEMSWQKSIWLMIHYQIASGNSEPLTNFGTNNIDNKFVRMTNDLLEILNQDFTHFLWQITESVFGILEKSLSYESNDS